MLNKILVIATLGVLAFLVACARPLASPPNPEPLPSPAAHWTMTLTQSGGFAGMMRTVVVSSDGKLTAQDQRSGRSVSQDLPADTVAKLGSLVVGIAAAKPVESHSNCADCFVYDLKVDAGGRSFQAHADDTTLAGSDTEALIRTLQGLRDIALK
jgi:hypothetical protein